MASTTRRLAAILAADVAGYSRLIGADEGGTLHALTCGGEVHPIAEDVVFVNDHVAEIDANAKPLMLKFFVDDGRWIRGFGGP